jgi:hypothetical protein
MKQEISPRTAIAVIAAVLVLVGVWWYWHSTVHIAGSSQGAQTPSAIGKSMSQSMREMGMERMNRMAGRRNPAGAAAPDQGSH